MLSDAGSNPATSTNFFIHFHSSGTPLKDDLFWMQEAFKLAQLAAAVDEVPVGAVVVDSSETLVIGEGWNQPISSHDPTSHAEIVALRNASQYLKNYRLVGTTLYVTLEPCLMCLGAMIHARVRRLVFATPDFKTGCVESKWPILRDFAAGLNHTIQVSSGVLACESQQLLQDFFLKKRKKLTEQGCQTC